MQEQKTELEKKNIVRLSNKQAKLMTKTCLQNALVQILDTKDINDISVSELTRRAGVSRTAFYSNYQTVDDVLSEMINHELEEVNKAVWNAINNKEDIFPPIVQMMKDNSELYSLVLKTNIEKTAFFQLRDYIKTTYPTIDKKRYYLLVACIGALRNIILEWFINGCDESVQTIAAICDASTRYVRDEVFSHL